MQDEIAIVGELKLRDHLYLQDSLPGHYTFTATGGGTYRDENGDTQAGGANEARFDHTADGDPLGVYLTAANNDLLAINSLGGSYTWWNEGAGAIIMRCMIDTLDGANHYPIVINDGSTADTIGLRVDTSNNLVGYVRAASVGQHTVGTNAGFIEGTMTVIGLSWDAAAGKATLYDFAGSREVTSITLPTGLTTINIGSRNGGSDDFNGHIAKLEIANRYLDEGTLRGRGLEAGDLVCAFAGQSLHSHIFSRSGIHEFLTTGQDYVVKPYIMHGVDGSTSGSSICYTSNNSDHWWDNSTDSEGTSLTAWKAAVQAWGGRVDYVLLKIGHGEHSSLNSGATTIADVEDALPKIFAEMRRYTNNSTLPILISPDSGRGDTVSSSLEASAQSLNEVWQDLISTADNNIYYLASSYDLAYSATPDDDPHLADASYDTLATREARRVADLAGYTVSGSTIGPQMASATWSTDTVTITLTHDGGTDFTPTTGIEGIAVFADGTRQTVSAAVRTNATTVTITVSASMAGASEVTVISAYGTLSGVTQANILVDNSAQALPLVPKKIVAVAA